MLARYRVVLTLPGARGPVAASILGSLPIGMFGLAILFLARDASGSYAVAGRVAGAFGLANAFGAVTESRTTPPSSTISMISPRRRAVASSTSHTAAGSPARAAPASR